MEIGTVSHGTLRPEDLIPAFMSALEDAVEESTFLPGADGPERVKRVGEINDILGEIDSRMLGGDGEDYREEYFDSEEAGWDIETLMDLLNEYAPEGTYFGASEGDGSDFGFWAVEA